MNGMKRIAFAIFLVAFLIILNVIVRADGSQESGPVMVVSGIYETPYRYGYIDGVRSKAPLMRIMIDREDRTILSLWDVDEDNDLSNNEIIVTRFRFSHENGMLTWLDNGVGFIFGFVPQENIYRLTMLNNGSIIQVDFELMEEIIPAEIWD